MSKNSMIYAQAIKVCIAEHQANQLWLAAMVNVSEQTVSRWARGAQYPTTAKLIEIAAAFDISLTEFISKGENSVNKAAKG